MKTLLGKVVLLIIIAINARGLLAVTVDATTYKPNLTVKDFVAERDFRDAELSPNGRYLAMVWTQNKIRYVVIKDLEAEGQPTIGFLGEQIIRPSTIKWANNERLIVQLIIPLDAKRVAKKVNDEDFDIYDYRMTYRTISVDINAKNPVMLLEDEGIGSFVSHYLPDDPEHVLMPFYSGRSWKYTLNKVNVYTGKSEEYVAGGPHTTKLLIDSKGTPLYRIDRLRVANAIEYFKYLGDDEWEEIERIDFDEDEDEKIDTEGLVLVGLSKDSGLVYLKRNEEKGYFEVVEINRENGEKNVIVSLPDQDVSGLLTDSRNDNLIGYTTQKDLVRKHYFDETKQQTYNNIVKQIGNNNVSLYWPVNEDTKAIAYTTGADNPGHFSVYDIKSKKLNPIHDSYLKLNYDSLGIPAITKIKMRDGIKIRTYILFPPNYSEGKAMPMVIMPHGGPHARDTAGYDHFAQFIATRGYIVVQPNFRGSSGYGLEFEEAGYKQWGGVMQDDITDTVNFMVKKGYALKEKVCIVGGSYGGYAALMGAVKTPELYRCGVSLNGVTHLKKQIKYDVKRVSKKYREKIRARVYKEIGHPQRDSEMLDKNSPALHADKIKIPFLIMAGEKDRVVPHYQSQQMVRALERLDKEVEYHEYEWAPHNIFRYVDDREEAFEKIEVFLAKHLSN